ncbi:MAG: hypothetical protein V2A61_05445 [Calditrichota bacterium]
MQLGIIDCDGEEEIRDRLDLLLCLAPEEGRFGVGADTGYTNDPSEITVWREDEDGVMKLILRLHTEYVAYPVLAEVIALIDRYYNPRRIGIDNGGNGMAVAQDLLGLDKFRGQEFETKIRGLDFGGATVIGYNEEGKAMRKRTKEYMTALINRALAKRKEFLSYRWIGFLRLVSENIHRCKEGCMSGSGFYTTLSSRGISQIETAFNTPMRAKLITSSKE